MKSVLLLVVACAASPAQVAVHETQSSILALEYAWSQAEVNADTKAMSALFDNGLVFVDYDGKLLTKAEYLARIRSNASRVKRVVTETMEVRVFADTAVVVGVYRLQGEEKGRPYFRRRRFIDTWMLVNGHWQCIAAAGIPIS